MIQRRNEEADVDRTRQAETATEFLEQHRAPPGLLLPNVRDGLSARPFVAAGFDALATISGGIAWGLGHCDGEAAPGADVVARITIASAPTLAAMSAIQILAAELQASKAFEVLASTLRHPDAQNPFS